MFRATPLIAAALAALASAPAVADLDPASPFSLMPEARERFAKQGAATMTVNNPMGAAGTVTELREMGNRLERQGFPARTN